MTLIGSFRQRTLGSAMVLTEACLAAMGVPRPSALLVLGHMRSGSTLLLHLLLTNPEVAALGERNAPYNTKTDFVRLAIKTRVVRRGPLRRWRYVVDQVNHNKFTPNSELLEDSRVRLVFLLRQPEASLASLLELSAAFYDHSMSAAQAVDYYVARLQHLKELAERIRDPTRAAFVTYENLTELPDKTLADLRIFLGLRCGFSKNYGTQPFTGKRGDPGLNIMAGKVVPNLRSSPAGLTAGERERLMVSHRQCREALERFALPLQPTPPQDARAGC